MGDNLRIFVAGLITGYVLGLVPPLGLLLIGHYLRERDLRQGDVT